MVARRAHRDEGVLDMAAHHLVDAKHRAAGGELRGAGAALAYHRVAIELQPVAGLGPQRQDCLDIGLRVNPGQLLDGCLLRLQAQEAGKTRKRQCGQYGT